MYRMEGSIVKRYADPLDEFIKIRKFSSEEVTRLLSGSELHNKSQYIQLILNACLVRYTEEVQVKLRQHPIDQREDLENGLYALVVDVNPTLDINQVAIPIIEECAAAAPIHLIEELSSLSKREEQFDRVRMLETNLNERVVGQADASHRLAQGIKKSVAGIRDPKKPVGSFMFVGQTGVGKTEMAKALASSMFETESSLLRIDCSEFALPHEYSKLIGSPPGYIGYNEGGQLTEKLKQRGGCVILFDEIEKADRKVHNLLLQILDEGFLTDGKGQRVACSEAVLIMTSNLGVSQLQSYQNALGFFQEDRCVVESDIIGQVMHTALHEFFSPEFINRVDEIVPFRSLSIDDCSKIIQLMLQEVAGYAIQSGLLLNYSDGVSDFLVQKGFAPEYGARELRRTVKRLLEGPLSNEIIEGKLYSGDRVKVGIGKDKLTFKRCKAA